MALVQGRPLLEWQVLNLKRFGIQRVIFSVGHLAEIVEDHFGNWWEGVEIACSRESKPLGTGGAIKRAFSELGDSRCFVLNGDSLFDLDLATMIEAHHEADLTLALKRMDEGGRYGSVECDGRRVKAFAEKDPRKKNGPQWVNGGVYLTSRQLFDGFTAPEAFSFEIDFLPAACDQLLFHHFRSEGFFIDIGLPEDYSKSQSEPFFRTLLKEVL